LYSDGRTGLLRSYRGGVRFKKIEDVSEPHIGTQPNAEDSLEPWGLTLEHQRLTLEFKRLFPLIKARAGGLAWIRSGSIFIEN
jgi:hypothetical protein